MTTLVFDGRTGASGDMLLGALLAVGADPDVLAPVEDAIPVTYRVEETVKNGIEATTVEVVPEMAAGDDGETGDGDAIAADHDHGDADPDHHADHEAPLDDAHAGAAEHHGPHRTLAECREILAGVDVPDPVREHAVAVFERLAEAESRVHGTDPAETHFHEVGADDAIADVLGVALLLDDLEPDRVLTTPVATGGGTVEMSHGRYPVPTPAVTYLAEAADWELRGGPVDTELLTPTGAALLAHFATGVEAIPQLAVERSGYGAGRKSLDAYPNVLHAILGRTRGGLVREDVRVLETNLDDATPEVLGGLQDSLSAAGALDVTVLPATMKKSRPGHLVKVVVAPGDVPAVARRLAEETGTLGVREAAAGHRWVAERSVEPVTVELDGERYQVGVKVATDDDGTVYDVSAEYDDAAAVAAETDRPIRAVMRLAEAAYRGE